MALRGVVVLTSFFLAILYISSSHGVAFSEVVVVVVVVVRDCC